MARGENDSNVRKWIPKAFLQFRNSQLAKYDEIRGTECHRPSARVRFVFHLKHLRLSPKITHDSACEDVEGTNLAQDRIQHAM
jgi:hypothetical protein